MLNISICDDSKTDLNFLSDLLKKWSKQREISIKTEIFNSAESFLFHYAEDKTCDILLLDIEMGEMDGVTMAKKLRHENDTVQIIFITGYSEYIAEGYEVSALNYLMKPLNPEKLFTVLDRACEKLKQNEKQLNLTLSGEMVRVPLHEIKFIDVQGNYVTVHAKENYTVKRTLSEFEAYLDDRFFRAGRSQIINVTFISRVTKKDIYLSDGTALPLPRGAYEPLNRAIIENT